MKDGGSQAASPRLPEAVDVVSSLKNNEVSLGELAGLRLDKGGVISRRLREATGDPERSAGADRPWRSDAGHGEAAAGAGRTARVIEVLHRCSVADGMTPFILFAASGVALLQYSGGGDRVRRLF
jgi:hypothetical protein